MYDVCLWCLRTTSLSVSTLPTTPVSSVAAVLSACKTSLMHFISNLDCSMYFTNKFVARVNYSVPYACETCIVRSVVLTTAVKLVCLQLLLISH